MAFDLLEAIQSYVPSAGAIPSDAEDVTALVKPGVSLRGMSRTLNTKAPEGTRVVLRAKDGRVYAWTISA